MEANIIDVGNSKGLIIPAKFLKLLGLKRKVKLEMENNSLIIKPIDKPRAGWEDMIRKEVKDNGETELLISDVLDSAENDWEW